MRNCYASLAIYSKTDREDEISNALQMPPSVAREKAGNFSWIYSTRDVLDREKSVEQHLQFLKCNLCERTSQLIGLARDGCEIRLWIYFDSDEINSAFVCEVEFINWLSSFDADICVDIWNVYNIKENPDQDQINTPS